MRIFESSFGIDFRQNHLLLTFLKKSFGKIRLVDYGVYPIPSETQKEEREAQILSLVNSFIPKHQVDKKRVSISIPREKVIVRFISLPVATKENLRKVMEYETSKYTPFEKGEVYFDYAILKEDKESIHLFVVFVKKPEVDASLALLKKIGIQPVSIQTPSTAALNLFFYHQGVRDGELSVLLEVTEAFFEMNVIQDKEWKESFHLPLPPEEAESKIIDTFKRWGLKNNSLSRASFFVYGLDANEKLFPSLRESHQIKGVFLPPLARIETEKGVSRPDKVFSSIGVPLSGLMKPQVDLNLLPFEMRKKVRQVGKPLLILLTALALILSLTWGVGIFFRHQHELNGVNAEVKKRKPEVEAIERLQKQKEQLGKELAELEKIRTEEISKNVILKELTQLLPDSVWIWSFRYNGKEIEINGFADSASNLIPLLDKSTLFEKVEFLAPVTKEKMLGVRGEVLGEKERFKIKMRLEGRRSGP